MKATQLGFKLITLAIVDEPVRFLTYEFLKLGDKSEQDPPLSTLVHDATSPLKAASQYLASLLLCKNERLALVHQSEGMNTIEDWERQRPQQVRSFRRMVLLCVAWLQRRHVDRLVAPPFGLSCLGDSRISQEKKEEIVAQWDSTNPCCVRPGMARKLKARGICGTDLLSSKCPVDKLISCSYFLRTSGVICFLFLCCLLYFTKLYYTVAIFILYYLCVL